MVRLKMGATHFSPAKEDSRTKSPIAAFEVEKKGKEGLLKEELARSMAGQKKVVRKQKLGKGGRELNSVRAPRRCRYMGGPAFRPLNVLRFRRRRGREANPLSDGKKKSRSDDQLTSVEVGKT